MGIAVADAPAYLWIEAEAPSVSNFEFEVQGGSQPEILSSGKWLHRVVNVGEFTKDFPQGWQLEYDFGAGEAGQYEFWARVGYERLRAPMHWQVDGGADNVLASDVPTTNLNEVWDGWNEVAWVRAGTVELSQGAHRLTLRYEGSGSEGNERVMVGLDCVVFVKGEGNFTPEGKLPPGQRYDGDIDRAAANHVYRLSPDPRAGDAERVELSLNGLWQVARYDDMDMDKDTYEPVSSIPEPDEYELRWMGVEVPGDAFAARKELFFGHRIMYQTRVELPKEYEGRSVKLHFAGTSWIVGVFVNGRYVGGHTSVLVPWDVDITDYVRFGQVNTIMLGVKSGWYAIDLTARKVNRKSLHEVRNIPLSHLRNTMFVDAIYPSSKGEGTGHRVGVVYPAKLVVMGSAYTSDVYVRTSVADKRIKTDVEVMNPTDKAKSLQVKCEAVHERTGEVEKLLGPVGVEVPAVGTATATLADGWENPKLWWPENPAEVYVMRTTLLANDEPIDRREDTFGFREVSIDGKHFLLNGIRWHFWNWVDVKDPESPDDWLVKFRENNNRFHRISDDHSRMFGPQEEALEWLDRRGIAGRKSTCIDGMFITHHTPNPLVWQNFERHVRQVVKTYRNHPSIMQWSLANEMILITSRLYYRDTYREDEKRMAHLFEIAKQLDPTRDSYDDGAGDCGNLGAINCQHYTWPRGVGFPQGAYNYPIGPAPFPRPVSDFQEVYKWDAKRPLVLGEVAYLTAKDSAIAWSGGPKVYLGRQYCLQAEADYLRVCIEGARWQDATAICPWTVRPAANRSFEPRAVFVREHNTCFYPDSQLSRTIAVFNDGRVTDPLTLKWKLRFYNDVAAAGEKTYDVKPGHHVEDLIVAKLPLAENRKDGVLELKLYADGEMVFEDSKDVAVLPMAGKAEGLGSAALAVYDPAGAVTSWLDARQLRYQQLDDLSAIPPETRVLVVGGGALGKEDKQTAAGVIERFVSAGGIALVLEQDEPLEGDDLPVKGIIATPPPRREDPGWMEFRRAAGQDGSICFPVIGQHAIFDGLAMGDFFTWAGDSEEVFRKSYAAPASGALPLAVAGGELALAPVLHLSSGKGKYILSQMLIAGRLGTEPVADRLLFNMLCWAAAQQSPVKKKTLAYPAGNEKLGEFLSSTGLNCTIVDQPEALLSSEADIKIVKAAPAAVALLNRNRDVVRQYCEKGGWLMLVGLDESGLDSFNGLVGFQHRIRAFGVEATKLQALYEPLLLGVGTKDVAMYSDEMMAPWMGLKKVSDVVFTNVVDGANIASFAEGVNLQLANGLTTNNFWQYIQYLHNPTTAKISLPLGRKEKLRKMNLWVNPSYYYIKDIEIVLDGRKDEVIAWTLDKTDQMQTLDLGAREASHIAIFVKSVYPGRSSQNIAGIDEIELIRELPSDFGERVVLLTRPGGLVKYPIGAGGIVLNQLDYTSDDTQENIQKKNRIYFNILNNMGASFRSDN